MTKNRTPTPVYLDLGMHPGLEVKGLNADTTGVAKLWQGYLAPCGEVTKAVARLLSLLWRGYQICGYLVARLQSGYR